MGGFSLWHWIIMLVIIGIPALLVGVVIWLIARCSRRSGNAAATTHTIPSSASQPVASRLQELAKLNSAGLLTDTEFERKRAEILESL